MNAKAASVLKQDVLKFGKFPSTSSVNFWGQAGDGAFSDPSKQNLEFVFHELVMKGLVLDVLARQLNVFAPNVSQGGLATPTQSRDPGQNQLEGAHFTKSTGKPGADRELFDGLLVKTGAKLRQGPASLRVTH